MIYGFYSSYFYIKSLFQLAQSSSVKAYKQLTQDTALLQVFSLLKDAFAQKKEHPKVAALLQKIKEMLLTNPRM